MNSEIRFAELAQLRKESVDPRSTPDSPYVGLEHIEPGSLQLNNFGRASDVTSQKLKFYKGDILFGKLRPYFRKIATAPLDGVCSTDIWVVTGKDIADNEFIKYWMASDTFIRSSTQAAEGSSMPRAQWSWVSEFRTSVVSGANRRSIGRLLGALDDKIALNLQTSQILEEIARTIFKSWFIDFDPVHAKSRGEHPEGMDAETGELFPDSFEESELGLIPSGWSWTTLADLAEVRFGAAFKSSLFNTHGHGMPLVRIRDLSTCSPSTFTSESHQKGFVVCGGELLVGMDGTFDPVIWTGSPAVVNQRIAQVLPGQGLSALFVKFSIVKQLKHLEANATGTTVGHLSKGELETIRLLSPGGDVLAAFCNLAGPILSQIVVMKQQNLNLASIRDALLPRLISGELEIPEELLVD